MTQFINTILENEEVKGIISENGDVIDGATEFILEFKDILKNFVLSNPQEFIGENIEQTVKNIGVFTEVATAQYITEISDQAGKEFTHTPEPSVSDYI